MSDGPHDTPRQGRPRSKAKHPSDHEPEAVAYARQQAGFTKAELARRLGISPALLSMIENGTRNAGHALMRRMAAELNCPKVVLERKREPERAPETNGAAA